MAPGAQQRASVTPSVTLVLVIMIPLKICRNSRDFPAKGSSLSLVLVAGSSNSTTLRCDHKSLCDELHGWREIALYFYMHKVPSDQDRWL
jgi:hypothetical protein